MGPKSVRARLPYSGWSWLSLGIIFAIATALTFTLRFREQVFVKETPQFEKARVPMAGPDMQAEDQGDHILLRWSQDNEIVQHAAGGVLHISDGSSHRDVQLDAALLVTGSILYRPVSDDVSFALEIRDQQGHVVTESMRLLDGAGTSHFDTRNRSPVPPSNPTTVPMPSATVSGGTIPHSHGKGIVATILDSYSLPVRRGSGVYITKHDEAQHDGSSDARQIPLERLRQSMPHTAASTGGVSRTSALPLSARTATSSPVTPSAPMKPSEGSPQPTSAQIPAATSSVINEPPDTTPPLKSSEMPNTEVVSNKPGRPVQPSGAPAISQGKPLLGVRTEAEPSPTFVPPEPIRQIMPDLRKFGMATTVSRLFLVEVIVKVNDKGRVTEARLVDDRSNRPPYITFAALEAAKQWTFRPATLRGQNIASDHTLVFRFGSDRH